MHLICRLRNDADVHYLHDGKPRGKRGRPKKYQGEVEHSNIRKDYFTLESCDDQSIINSTIVYSKSLKRKIKLVHVCYNNGKQTHKLSFSTDIKLEALDVLKYYQSRFQIEFLYRDGKQPTGINDCQARSKNKLDFHFNASLTAINIAKIAPRLSIPKEQCRSFSMRDVKTINHNSLQLKLFFGKYGLIHTYQKIKRRQESYCAMALSPHKILTKY